MVTDYISRVLRFRSKVAIGIVIVQFTLTSVVYKLISTAELDPLAYSIVFVGFVNAVYVVLNGVYKWLFSPIHLKNSKNS